MLDVVNSETAGAWCMVVAVCVMSHVSCLMCKCRPVRSCQCGAGGMSMSTESEVVQIYAEVGGFPNAQYIRSPVSKEPITFLV